MNRPRAFTLVEMLLVVAIIVLLISMLLPAMSRARQGSDRCKNNLANLGQGISMFALDNQQRIPAASIGGWQGTEQWQKCWVGSEGKVPGRYEPAHVSPLAPYLGGAGGMTPLLRCPNLVKGVIGSGVGSNGGFDYAMILSFGGGRMSNLPSHGLVRYMSDPMSPTQTNLRMPLLIEENPAYHNNSISIEPGFGSIDQNSTHHLDRSCNYLAVDGGVANFPTSNPRPPQAWEWFTTGKSGVEYRLNGYGVSYGYWRGK